MVKISNNGNKTQYRILLIFLCFYRWTSTFLLKNSYNRTEPIFLKILSNFVGIQSIQYSKNYIAIF